MFEELEAHQEKAMAQEGSLKCEYKSYFFPELISLSVEELERKEGSYRPWSVMKRHELLLILEQKVIFVHGELYLSTAGNSQQGPVGYL